MPITKITNVSSEFIPTTANTHRQVTIGATAADWLSFTPTSGTKYLVWSLSGGDVRITVDGSDPDASTGYVIADGSTGVWNPKFADDVIAIRSGATDGVFDIMEVDAIGGY